MSALKKRRSQIGQSSKYDVSALFAKDCSGFDTFREALNAFKSRRWLKARDEVFLQDPREFVAAHSEVILEGLLSTSDQMRIRVRLSPLLDVEQCLRKYALFFDSIVFTPRLPGIQCGLNPAPYEFDLPFQGSSWVGTWVTDTIHMWALMASAQPLFEAKICHYLPVMFQTNAQWWDHPLLTLPAIEHPYLAHGPGENGEHVFTEAANQYLIDTRVSEQIGALHPHNTTEVRATAVKDIVPATDDPDMESLAFGTLALNFPNLADVPWSDVLRIREDYHPELLALRRSITSAFRELVGTDPTSQLARKRIAGIQSELIDEPLQLIEQRLRTHSRRLFKRQGVPVAVTAGLGVTALLGVAIAPPVAAAIGGAGFVSVFKDLVDFFAARQDLKKSPLFALKKARKK